MGAGMAGLFGGILEGIGQGIGERQRRQAELKQAGLNATMQVYSQIMKDASAEARPDIMKAGLDAVRSVVAPQQYQKEHGGKKGQPDPIGVFEQAIGPILSKRYPDASRPEQEQSVDLSSTGLPESISKLKVTIPQATKGAIPSEAEKEQDRLRNEQKESEQKFKQNQAQIEQQRAADLRGLIGSPGFNIADPAQQQRMIIAQTERQYGIPPASQSEVSWQRVHVQDDKGAWMPAWANPKTREFTTADGKPLGFTPKEVTTGEPSAEKADKDVPEVVQLARDHEAAGMSKDDALKQARKDHLAKFQSTEKGKEERSNEAEERLKKLRGAIGPNANSVIAMADKYTPGGKSVANPQGSGTIEGLAWEWVTTGHIPYLGMGQNPDRERAIARGLEIMKDGGLEVNNLPAIRANVKADTSALAKITSYGTQIGQFEGTLTRNAELAQRLSAGFPRFDARFANQVYQAFEGKAVGNSAAVNYAAQLHGLANEWGKLMAGSVGAAGVPMSEAAATDQILKALGNNSLDSLITDVIKPDAANRSTAVLEQRQKLMQGLREAVTKPGVTLGEAAPQGTAEPSSGKPNTAPSGKPYIGSAIGPGGHTIKTDGVKWYDPATGKEIR